MLNDWPPRQQDAVLAALIQIGGSVLVLAYWAFGLQLGESSPIARTSLPWLGAFLAVSALVTWRMPTRLELIRKVVLGVLLLYFESSLAVALFGPWRVDLKWLGLVTASLPLLYVTSFALLVRRVMVFPVVVAVLTMSLCAGRIFIGSAEPEAKLASAQLALIQPLYLVLLVWIDRQRRRRIAVQYEALGSRLTMLGMITHELRTPLQVIGSAADGLAKRSSELQLSALDQKFLNRIRSSTAQLNARLRDLIVITKHASGLSPATHEEFDLAAYVKVILDDHRAMAAEKGNDLRVELASDCAIVRGDVGRVHQIVSNVVSNAIKYTRAGTVVVKVFRHLSESKDGVCFVVEDTGIGIEAQQIERIWEPYYRISNDPHVALTEGSGLGLSVVRLLVEMLGGTISVTSVPAKGTQFRVWLPLTTS